MSTVLSYILGSLPGVLSIGESHWIITKRLDGWHGCVECGERINGKIVNNCSIFTDGLMAKMAQNTNHWYDLVSQAANINTVAASDKHWTIYDRLQHPTHGVLLYRDFRALVSSYIIRQRGLKWDSEAHKIVNALADRSAIKKRCAILTRFYSQTLRWLQKNSIDWWLIDADLFAAHPQTELQQLCAFLNIPYRQNAIYYWRFKHHSIGGHFNLREPPPIHGRKLHPINEWQKYMSNEVAQQIEEETFSIKTQLLG